MVLHGVGSYTGYLKPTGVFPRLATEHRSHPFTSPHSRGCQWLHAASTQGSGSESFSWLCAYWEERRSETLRNFQPCSSPNQWWIEMSGLVSHLPCLSARTFLSHILYHLPEALTGFNQVTCPLMHLILAFSNSLSHFSTPCLESTAREPNLTHPCFLDYCLPLSYKMSIYQIRVELELLSHLALYRPSGWRKGKKVGLRPFLSTRAEAISMCFTSCFTSIIPFELNNLKFEKKILKIKNLGKLIFTYWNPICISFLLLL